LRSTVNAMQQSYEEFTEPQERLLLRFVTNTNSNVFVLRNLPEVIKGALFSRYSRSSLGLRSLLLKEFIQNDETAFQGILGESPTETPDQQVLAIRKAQNFYDRILDGYGDDSIGELGGAHLALENVSMLAAKLIEDRRIGGSPLEKSTRYIYFDQKVGGDYLFYREPVLMTSAYRDLYVDTCNMLFDTYSRLIPELTAIIEERNPREPDASAVAYNASLRAKVLDCLRGLLPASTLTNVGVFGNGRFFEYLLQRLQTEGLAESQELGRKAYEELSKVIPSFVRRGDLGHRHGESFARFHDAMLSDLAAIEHALVADVSGSKRPGVRLVHSQPEAPVRVAAALLYPLGHASLSDLEAQLSGLPEEEINRVLEAAASARDNRRHKSPRGLEVADYTFEVITDFGAYRDLQRHRMLTQERQSLSCRHGYSVPPELVGLPMEAEYCRAMEKAQAAWQIISQDFPEEAQYIVPMGFNIRWMMHVNLRGLQWLCELRSQPQGHPAYRQVAQELARAVIEVHPSFERFFRFVDFEAYELGRFAQERRRVEKAEAVPHPS
jgi:thymidylate synthase ThyX